MSTRAELQLALDAAVATSIFDRAVVLDEARSTQDDAKSLCGRGGLVVATVRQTAGRGTHGRSWADTAHHGLAITYVLPNTAIDLGKLSLAAGAAAAYTCRMATPEGPLRQSVGLKWPNDVVCERNGRLHKVGGILIEVHQGFPLVGIGLNVSHSLDDLPGDLASQAISLHQLGSTESRAQVAERLTKALAYTLSRSDSDVVAVWKKFDRLTGRTARLLHDGRMHEGTVEAIDPLVEIQLRTPTGIVISLPARSTSVAKD